MLPTNTYTNMFQTITYKCGHINLTNTTTFSKIEAWCHGEKLGTYKTIPAAKRAITIRHDTWVRERTDDHMSDLERIWHS